jgi:hypothetical protein
MSIVLVECVSMFRMRYAIETPDDHPEWALDTVTLEEADDFSQEHLGETIVSHRVISREDLLALHDVDHDYLATAWTDEQKLQSVHKITDTE